MCRLTADLHVRGKLIADPTGVDLDGQGLFDIHTHGGILDLRGTPKTGWTRWGDSVSGWQTGDRLVVAETTQGVISAGKETTWGESWAATTRPPGTADVILDGVTHRPEVANLTRSLTIRNMTRIMMHEPDASAIHTLKHLQVLNCGKTDTLGHYPIHFHLLGESSRGSLVEGVVVEGGKFRAFVPHGSHGVTFKDCVAYRTTRSAYWWDSISNPNDPGPHNASHDTAYDHCLALGVTGTRTDLAEYHATAGFQLGKGDGSVVKDSVAVGVVGGQNAAGFIWPEFDHSTWGFTDNVAHNNQLGLFVWQNDDMLHIIERYQGFRNNWPDIRHGAYINSYRYTDVSTVLVVSIAQSGLPRQRWDRLRTEEFYIGEHTLAPTEPVEVVNSRIGRIRVEEDLARKGGWYKFVDCGLTPVNFILTRIHPSTILEIYEGTSRRHRWAGSWA